MSRWFEPATSVVFVVTSAVTALSLFVPSVLAALERTPAAGAGEPWRLVTALFVERGGAAEIALNLVTLAVVGTLAERAWGSRAWLVFYLFGGVVGEIAGLAWKPVGAGSSVAMLGLAGGCATLLLRRRTSPLLVLLGALLLAAGAVLTYLRNLHGPPLLAEALAACFLRERLPPARSPSERA
ncbi:MAG TPA: rhomboid family intramembrane serine protease [Polyangiaceae bacterium]|nr:rhomboid family intramembrane serine protease [Polyangiaceae bacterium]